MPLKKYWTEREHEQEVNNIPTLLQTLVVENAHPSLSRHFVVEFQKGRQIQQFYYKYSSCIDSLKHIKPKYSKLGFYSALLLQLFGILFDKFYRVKYL